MSKLNKTDKIGDNARTLIKERGELFVDRRKNIKKIEALSKNITKSIRDHKKEIRFNSIQSEIEKTGGIKRVLKKLKDHTSWIPKMKGKNKENKEYTTSKRTTISKIATAFYKSLYSSSEPSAVVENPNKEEEVPYILESETRQAILSQKNDKAPGEDRITNEMLKASLDAILKPLTSLFNKILDSEFIPEQWTKSTIILIHKKGDKDKIDNYRPISLMTNIYKVFSKIILGRLTKRLDAEQPREQAGFRADFSTVDHMHVVKQVTEKYKEYRKPYYISFVDYNKAFDSLSHNYLYKALDNQGIENKYISLIKNIYSNSTAKVQLEIIGEEFKIQKGVRQGDPLSPKLFLAVLEEIFRNLDWERWGININGCRLSHLRFADDLVLFAEDPVTLQEMLLQLTTESQKAGLTMNTTKTKVMTNSHHQKICVNDHDIEYVNDYTYLGQVIAPNLQMDKELQIRVNNTWARYWSLKEILKNKNTPMPIKRKVFNMCILPILTYGCQTWGLTKAHSQKLKVCQQGIERSMLHIKLKDKWRLTKIRKTTGVTDVSKKIKRLKWRWIGHVVRSTKEKWTKEVISWYPRDVKRTRGRPQRRWEDDLPQGWRRSAMDRQKWRILEEAYVQGGQPDR